MTAPIARTLSFTYGGFVIGGASSDYILHGDPPYSVEIGADQATASCTFIVRGDPGAADFKTKIDPLRTALQTPRARLVIADGVTVLHDFDPLGGTTIALAFNQDPTLSKPGVIQYDGGRAALFTATWVMDLPATLYADSEQRDSTLTPRYTGSRVLHFDLRVEYRASVGDSAYDNYLSGIAGDVSAAIALLGGGFFDTTSEAVTEINDTNTILTATRTLKKIIFPQATGVTDHAAIVAPTLNATRVADLSGGDSPGVAVSRVQRITASYSTEVDVDVETDLVGLYDGTIRPFILKTVKDKYKATSVAIETESDTEIWYDNEINAELTLIVYGAGNILSYEVDVQIHDDPGEVLTPMRTGNPYSRLRELGPATLRRTITERAEVIGKVVPRGSTEYKPGVFVSQSAFDLAEALFPPGTIGRAPGGAKGGKWSIPITTTTAKPRTTGKAPDAKTTTAVDTVAVQIWYVEYVPPKPPRRALGTRTS